MSSERVLHSKHFPEPVTVSPGKPFLLPTFGVTLTNDLNTYMNPLALAIAIELDQIETMTQERRSAFVELAFEGYLFNRSLQKMLDGLKGRSTSLG